jgi:AhpD family alkylhydroperoxidase
MESKILQIPPIERPRGLLMRFVYWLSRRQFGKVITPLKVIYACKPRLVFIARQFENTENGLSLDPAIRYLVKVQVSRLNACRFCEDIGLAMAVKERIGAERSSALDEYRTSEAFSARERAALAFAEEATRDRKVTDET